MIRKISRSRLRKSDFFDFEELHFEVYEGKGGHLPGEIVLIDYAHHIAITGEERKAIMQRLGVGQWQIFGAHGLKKIMRLICDVSIKKKLQ